MSWQPAADPRCLEAPGPSPVEMEVVPRVRDLGGFEVRRVLPSSLRAAVGPFVFFDQMGPARFDPGAGIDVRPHPHIGLATLTYLFRGEIVHRDSLGSLQPIRPGEVNWMTAGRGIVHSERTGPEARRTGAELYGIQSWLALPRNAEETEPAFAHHPAGELPILEEGGARIRLVAGEAWGARAPTPDALPSLFYADVTLARGSRVAAPPDHEERAVYPLEGAVELSGMRLEAGRLFVLRPGEQAVVQAGSDARLLLVGGAALDGPRHLWWNFVSSSTERIEQAKADWREGRFPSVPDDPEFIPLPES